MQGFVKAAVGNTSLLDGGTSNSIHVVRARVPGKSGGGGQKDRRGEGEASKNRGGVDE